MTMLHRFIPMLFAAMLCGCGGAKEGPRDAAQRFFALCMEGKTTAAYEQASVAFKLTRTAKYFEARVRDLGLDTAKRVEWGEPEPRGRAMKLRGEFTLKDGGKFTLNLAFIEENGRGGCSTPGPIRLRRRARWTMSSRSLHGRGTA